MPLLRTFSDVYPEFQSQGGSPACFVTCVDGFLRFTSGVIPVGLMAASVAVKPF